LLVIIPDLLRPIGGVLFFPMMCPDSMEISFVPRESIGRLAVEHANGRIPVFEINLHFQFSPFREFLAREDNLDRPLITLIWGGIIISDDSLLSECLPMLKVSNISHSNEIQDFSTNQSRMIELEAQLI
jgi:hypothetical protein